KMNNLRFELFAIIAQIDRSRYPLAYLFLENNRNLVLLIQRKLQQVLDGIEKADWHKSFKKECYFFICKYLVLQKGTIPVEFFDKVYHYYQYPFLDTLDIQSNIEQSVFNNIDTTNFKIIEDEENMQ
ncbi:5520_t:CDS:2, partial [Scutellospora calospora]